MSFLSKVLSALAGNVKAPNAVKAVAASGTASQKPKFRIRDGYLEADEHDFFGAAHLSPSKQWVVGCDDSDGGGHGGNRERGNGRVVLVEMPQGFAVCEVRSVARPFDVAVSNVGTFAVNDTGFGNELAADAVAFDFQGTELYRRRYSANIFSIAISTCGRFMAVQTCNAPKSPDGNLFEVHDILSKATLFAKVPETPWSKKFAFDVEGGAVKQVWAYVDGLGRFAYSPSGEFIGAKKYQAASLDKGDYASRLFAVEKLLRESSDSKSAERALAVLESVAPEVPHAELSWQAKACRLKGEAMEALGRMAEAVSAYEVAIGFDPKIGVKKRLDSLRKRIA